MYDWGYHRDKRKASEVSVEERQAFIEELYHKPGYGIWLGTFRDLLLSKEFEPVLGGFCCRQDPAAC